MFILCFILFCWSGLHLISGFHPYFLFSSIFFYISATSASSFLHLGPRKFLSTNPLAHQKKKQTNNQKWKLQRLMFMHRLGWTRLFVHKLSGYIFMTEFDWCLLLIFNANYFICIDYTFMTQSLAAVTFTHTLLVLIFLCHSVSGLPRQD